MTTEISHESLTAGRSSRWFFRKRRDSPKAGGSVKKNVLRRVLAAAMMAALLLSAAISFAVPSHADGDKKELANLSFYNLSSNASAFFTNARSPEGDIADLDGWSSVSGSAANGGSLLGYVDDGVSSVGKWLSSSISGSSSSMGYDSLIDGGGKGKYPGVLDYAHFGATLNALGLDSMGTGLSLGFMPVLGGSVMMILYMFTGLVDLIFVLVIQILQQLNPFRMFYAAIVASGDAVFASGIGKDVPGWLSGASSFIGEWYTTLKNIAWTVIVPLFIGFLILGLVLFKNMNRGGAFKKLAIRLVFIGMGLPLLGSLYTASLDSMEEIASSGSAGSTQVVLSTYVDFENWATRERLRVPEGAVIEWNTATKEPSAKAMAGVRNSALEINKLADGRWASITSSVNVAEDVSFANAAIGADDDTGAGGIPAYAATIDLLRRYMAGNKMDAATYENLIVADIGNGKFFGSEKGQESVGKWFTNFGKADAMPAADVVAANPLINVAGGLTAVSTGSTTTYTSPGDSFRKCAGTASSYEGAPVKCNLSPVAMYNYLNTSFGSASAIMYSSEKVSSGATREMHNSVTPVGTGIMSGLYWLNSVILLASFVIIGLGYALSMLFSNIKRSMELIAAVPFATLGAMSGIAKVVIYSIAMVLEIIATLFIYKFVQVFLVSIPQMIEMPFSALLTASSGDSAGAMTFAAGMIAPTITIMSIIAFIAFTVVALRLRKTLVKAINEVVTKLVDKFMETSSAPPGGGGMMPALAGGLASGAGMAAASKAMGGTSAAGGGKKAGGTSSPAPLAAAAVGGDGAGPGGGPSAPDGALAIEGGASSDVSGSIGDGGSAGPDGSAGPSGSGNAAMAREIEAGGGLSNPEVAGSTGGTSKEVDVGSTMDASMDKTAESYKDKDAAIGKGGVAAAKLAAQAYAGDAAGAAGSAQELAGAAQQAHGAQKDIDAAPVSTTGADGGAEGDSSGGAAGPSAGPVAADGGSGAPAPAADGGVAPMDAGSAPAGPQAADAPSSANAGGSGSAGAVVGAAALASKGGTGGGSDSAPKAGSAGAPKAGGTSTPGGSDSAPKAGAPTTGAAPKGTTSKGAPKAGAAPTTGGSAPKADSKPGAKPGGAPVKGSASKPAPKGSSKAGGTAPKTGGSTSKGAPKAGAKPSGGSTGGKHTAPSAKATRKATKAAAKTTPRAAASSGSSASAPRTRTSVASPKPATSGSAAPRPRTATTSPAAKRPATPPARRSGSAPVVQRVVPRARPVQQSAAPQRPAQQRATTPQQPVQRPTTQHSQPSGNAGSARANRSAQIKAQAAHIAAQTAAQLIADKAAKNRGEI